MARRVRKKAQLRTVRVRKHVSRSVEWAVFLGIHTDITSPPWIRAWRIPRCTANIMIVSRTLSALCISVFCLSRSQHSAATMPRSQPSAVLRAMLNAAWFIHEFTITGISSSLSWTIGRIRPDPNAVTDTSKRKMVIATGARTTYNPVMSDQIETLWVAWYQHLRARMVLI